MNNYGEFSFFADKSRNRLIKGCRKAVWAGADHHAGHLYFMLEGKQWEADLDGLRWGNLPLRIDENAVGPDIFNDIAKYAFLDVVFSNNVGRAADVVASVSGFLHRILQALVRK